LKIYRAHNCTRTHRDPRTLARCIWRRSHWVLGNGAYASVSRCRGTTVVLHPTAEQAETAKRVIDATACGGACVRRHEVIGLAQFLTTATMERAA
jgi:hypothetical protein